jgi:hypothetical protein
MRRGVCKTDALRGNRGPPYPPQPYVAVAATLRFKPRYSGFRKSVAASLSERSLFHSLTLVATGTSLRLHFF